MAATRNLKYSACEINVVSYIVNRIGERTPPCGTPILEVKGSPTVLFTLILRVRFLKKLAKSYNREPWIPKQCILYNSPSSHIESNAFCKSINIPAV